MNKFEEIKAARDGLDVLPDILRYAREGWESITDDDKARMKWYGLFYRKHTPGRFMLRVRIPSGVATAEQMRVLARITTDFGRDEMDITTRQQIQVRWFQIQDVPEMFERLRVAGIEHRQTGMDNIRGVMGCSLAGLARDEVLDASPAVRGLSNRLVGDKAFSNLPRKFNVSITGCPDNCVPAASQDLALVPAVRHTSDGPQFGFNVHVGGKMGSGGFTPARPLDVFVTLQHAEELCVQIIFIFRDHGLREARARARLAFLLDEWGLDRFREELQARCHWTLSTAGDDLRHTWETDHLGVVAQRQPGLYALGLGVPVGRLKATQVSQVADLAEENGDGLLRLTPAQNIVIAGVPGSRLRTLLEAPVLNALSHDPAPSVRGTVACTGIGLCDLALTDTKAHALAVARRLEPSVPRAERPISINWSGCPAGCGNHQAADIGLQGGKARVDGKVQEVYSIFVGGRLGTQARAGRLLASQVAAAQVPAIIERLAVAHANGADLLEVGASMLDQAESDAVPLEQSDVLKV